VRIVSQFLVNYAVLVGAHWAALQTRTRIPIGNMLGADYNGSPLPIYALFAIALAVVYGLAALLGDRVAALLHTRRPFRVLAFGALFSTVGVLAVLPDVSQLQMIYFLIIAMLIGAGVVGWANRLVRPFDPYLTGNYLRSRLANLWRGRHLLRLWLGYNIQARYSQMILGIMWIVLLPLSTAAVLALGFSQFLRVDYEVPYVAFFMAALVPYGLFSQTVQNCQAAVISRMALINQVPFPREVLVFLVVGEALVDLFFTFGAMLVVNALSGVWPNGQYVYLPLLLILLAMVSVGIGLFISIMSVIVRDIPQLVGVALQLLFYLTPIIYPIERIPPQAQVIALFNPLAGIIGGFREVILHGRPPDLISLAYPAVFGVALLFTGYVFFISHDPRLADYA
jgi:lipopolysaccharide transport system permease protein